MRILIFILLGAVIGIAIGWRLAPRSERPAGDPETQLRQRATAFYAASRRLDKLSMMQMYTPARQLDEAEELQKDSDALVKASAGIDAEAKKEAEQTAAGIKPAQLDVTIEGGWAVTGGPYDLIAFDTRIAQQLDKVVWVRQNGQWWVYNFKLVERNAYGNPPDFAMVYDPLH